MRRRRSYLGRQPRTKKIRSAVRVKERVAKKGGRCAGCKSRYEAGADVTVVNIRRKTYHRHTCVPANVHQLPTAGGPTMNNTPEEVVKALSINWSVGEAQLVAMLSLENALVATAKTKGITSEMERAFEVYNKLKARAVQIPQGESAAIRQSLEQEAATAKRMAIINLVKTIF